MTAALVREQLPAGVTLRDLGEHRLKDLVRPEHIYQLIIPGLTADFPPLKTLDALPNNLPIQLTSFVGREREMAEVKSLLSTTRLLTLTGADSCGKTRLALQVAADLRGDEQRRDLEGLCTDGVWFVEFASLADPALVAQRVATTLDVREQPGQPLLTTLTYSLTLRSGIEKGRKMRA